MPLVFRYAARSDVGLVRQGNEDSGFASDNLLIVADGMGGHVAGEMASATVTAAIPRSTARGENGVTLAASTAR